ARQHSIPWFSLSCSSSHPNLHSFPTRRSSDLDRPHASQRRSRVVHVRRGPIDGNRKVGLRWERRSTPASSRVLGILELPTDPTLTQEDSSALVNNPVGS